MGRNTRVVVGVVLVAVGLALLVSYLGRRSRDTTTDTFELFLVISFELFR